MLFLKKSDTFGAGYMKALSIREMRDSRHLESLLAKGEELTLTKNGHEIARILPIQKKLKRPNHQVLHNLTASLSVSSTSILREMRDER